MDFSSRLDRFLHGEVFEEDGEVGIRKSRARVHWEVKSPSFLHLKKSPEGKPSLKVRQQYGKIWLSQVQLARFFGISKSAITQHLEKIFASLFLDVASVSKHYYTTAADTKNYDTKMYSEKVLLALAFRIHTPQAKQLQQWMITTLSEYLLKGFAIDEEKLRDKHVFATNHPLRELKRLVQEQTEKKEKL